MKLEWSDFDEEKDKNMDEWLSEDYSPNSAFIEKYAGVMNGNSVVEDVKQQRERMKIRRDIFIDFQKVARHNGETVGLTFIRCYRLDVEKKEKFKASINPIIVNPRFVGMGYGTAMLEDLVKDIKLMTGLKISEIEASVNPENERSLKIFRKQGFKETRRIGGIYFRKKLKRSKNKTKQKKRLQEKSVGKEKEKND